MNDLQLNILALDVAIKYAIEVIDNPETPKEEKVIFEKYLEIYKKAQRMNMDILASNY